MHHPSLSLGIFVITLLAGATAAQAANESWVSGTGTDAGTCPRTAPCRTFQFAHDQTSNNGAINVLTPGNFGPLIITKAISIVADGVEAVINTTAGGAAILVQAGGSAVVSLRGLTIDMRGTGKNGITFISGGALHVRNCVIRRTAEGIRFAPASGTPELYISDSTLAGGGQSGNIYIQPADGANAVAVLNRVRVEKGSGGGIMFQGSFTGGNIIGTVSDSVVAGNGSGIFAQAAGGAVNVMVDRSVTSDNGAGVWALGAGATIRIGNSTVSGNGEGLRFESGGQIISYETNQVNGNDTDGAPSSTIATK